MGEHMPSAMGRLQAPQGWSQATAQQTPSTHMPLAHSAPSPQGVPGAEASWRHTPSPSQTSVVQAIPSSQSSSDAHGGRALYSPADMSKPEEIAEMIALADREFGGCDILIELQRCGRGLSVSYAIGVISG